MDSITEIYERKKQVFWEQNKKLYKIFSIATFFTFLILMIFAPLPGNLMIEGKVWYAKLYGFLFFVGLSAIGSFLYFELWTTKEIFYLNYVMGIKRSFYAHARCFCAKFWIYPFFVFAALLKTHFDYKIGIYILVCCCILLCAFYFFYKKTICSKQKKTFSSFSCGKIYSLIFSINIKLKFCLITVLMIFSLIIKNSDMQYQSAIYYLNCFSVVIFFLLHSILKGIRFNIYNLEKFTKYINIKYYLNIKKKVNLVFIVLSCIILCNQLICCVKY